jgi:hypothetical protein
MGKGRRVVRTLRFEFSNDVCDSASTRRAPEFPAINHDDYRRLNSSAMAMAPKRKATRQPTMERPRTRAQVQQEGPPSSQMDTRESSELSTPPREQAESEPDREKMDTGDSPPEAEPSASESGRDIRGRSAPEDSGEEPPNRPICCNCRAGSLQIPSFVTSKWTPANRKHHQMNWNVTGRYRLIGKRGIALTRFYGGQRQGASCFPDSQ